MLVDVVWKRSTHTIDDVGNRGRIEFIPADGGLRMKWFGPIGDFRSGPERAADPVPIDKLSFESGITRLGKGIYSGGFNIDHDLREHTNYKVIDPYYRSDLSLDDPRLDIYGVADSIEQILGRRKFFVETDEEYVLSVVEIRKSDEPETGGWRWHKWGEYIGDQEPTCEYIHDEPIIESVVVFNFVRVERNILEKLADSV